MIDYMACVKHIAQQEASARGVMDATPYPARALESWGHLPPPPWQDLCSKSAAVSQAGRYQPGDSREAQQDRCAACTASPRACAHSGALAHDAVLLVLTLEHVQDAHARLEAARGAGQWHPAPPPALAC